VREFVERAAGELGIGIRWEEEGVDEVGIIKDVRSEELGVRSNTSNQTPKINPGQVIVRVDPRYFRPTEVESLLGDPSKAKNELGWEPKITFDELVKEMVQADMEAAKRDALVQRHGFRSFNYHE
jgi:GDPmannose 4,6-dehydratase